MSWLKSLRLARSNLPLTRRSSAFFCCRLMVPDSDRSVARPTRRALSTFTTLRSMVTTMGAALCSASALSLPARSAPGPASKEGIRNCAFHRSGLRAGPAIDSVPSADPAICMPPRGRLPLSQARERSRSRFCQVTPCGENPHKTDIDRGNADIRRNGLVIGRRDYVGPVLRVTRDLDGEVEGKLHPPGILHPPIDSNAADLARFAQVDCQPRRIGRGGGPAG